MRLVTAVGLSATVALAPALASGQTLAENFMKLSRGTDWNAVDKVEIGFPTHHPQGMVKIGDRFYVTSVEIVTPTTRYDTPKDGYDRDTGEGRGHLFEFGSDGELISDTPLGEGSIYHPGGMDYDGEYIWAPAAEYRPNSHSIIYRVDPETNEAEEVLRVDDHIGGVVHDTDANTLFAVSWGSRRLYTWPLDDSGELAIPQSEVSSSRVPNPEHYIDYQDCQYASDNRALCSGLASYRVSEDSPEFRLGGMELVSTVEAQPLWQVPVALWAPSGLPMTQNPFFVESEGSTLRAYFMPDDDKSTLFVFETETE